MPERDKTREQLTKELKELHKENETLKITYQKDIAKCRLAEDKLRVSQELLKMIFDYAPYAFYLFDLEGNFIDGNRAMELLLGYNNNELIGKNIFKLKLLSPKHQLFAAELLAKTMLGQSTGPCELVFNRKDGSKITAEISTHPIKVKDRALVLGIAKNITINIRTEEMLRESEQNLREKKTELSLLSNATFSFLESATTDKIYNFLGEKLYTLSGADYMVMSEYHEKNKSVSIRQLFGNTSSIKTIEKIVGIDFSQIQVSVKDMADQFDFSQRNKIYQIEGGFYFLSVQEVSKTICQTIERFLEIVELFSIGIIWKGNYYGGLTFCFKKGNQLQKQNLIESVVNQAALALSRKYTEETLINSEESYRRFFNDNLAGTYKISHDGTILMCNPAFAHIIGCKSDEQVLQMNLNDFYIEQSDRNDYLNKLKEKGKIELYESTLLGFDGRIIHLVENGVAKYDENGEMIEITGYLLDITDRKKASEKIIESEQRFQSLAQISPVGIFRMDTNGTLNYVNPEWCHIIGISAADALKKGWLHIVHPDDRNKLEAYWKASTKEQTSSPSEYRFIRPDGTIVWVIGQAVPEKDSFNEIVGYVGTITNISKLMQAEESLRESEEKFRTFFNKSPNGIELYDANGMQTNANQASLDMFGVKNVVDLLQFNIFDGISLDVEKKEKLLKGEPVAYQAILDFEIINKLKQYKTEKTGKYCFDYYITPLLASDKKIIQGYLLQVQDVTNRIHAEKELKIAKEKAEESDRLKSAFLANMSHEIRTPMNGILGFAELLKEPNLTGKEQSEYIHIIKKSGARMLNIINNIIEISKIESGQMDITIAETNISILIDYLFTFFKPEAESKGLQMFIKNTLTQKDSFIKTDKEKIFAILTNLIKNAIKYCDKGFIEIGLGSKKSITVASPPIEQIASQELLFFVKDTGIGIPEDRNTAIFDRFVQADIADQRAFQGAGLGLSISKAYVEILGGEIWVESIEGKGSIFYFTIPYNIKSKKNKESKSIHTTDAEDNRATGLKILIAEDNNESTLLLKIALKTVSKEIIFVKTGIDAVKTCLDNPDIDLVLMDIKMPIMDGYEATRQIRQFNSKVLIIAQTAYALTGDKEKAIDSGCNDYISKPIRKVKLLALLKKHFRK